MRPQVVIDKSTTDDQLLDAFRAEIQRLKTMVKQTKDTNEGVVQVEGSRMNESYASTLKRSVVNANGSMVSTDPHDIKHDLKSGPEEELITLRGELQRLKRLCKNQAEQLDSQDITIRELKKQLQPY